MNELALFAGAGGGILSGNLLGWTTIGAVEIEPYCREVLLARQRDGILPVFPIWDDVCTFDGTPWRGVVDVVTGGFPCQDISAAGKGAGITGERSGLWKEMHRIIREIRPRYAFMENSPMLTSRGLGTVLGDLAEIGYDAAWTCLSAADCGAPHVRERIWILAVDTAAADDKKETGAATDRDGSRLGEVAHANQERRNGDSFAGGPTQAQPGTVSLSPAVPDSHETGQQEQRDGEPEETQYTAAERSTWGQIKPTVGRGVHGVAHRVDRIAALGNGQVPIVAATAFKILKLQLDKQ